uniref:glycerol-3-phosphate dehydrogenase n=1 Tax=Thaumasiovibrio occultus TaxID=1891184 RepID=UPI000B354B81|nr:glycerol-3-phosphate dehydrogenase [Thaumasiovibrio occultus]
MTTLDLIVVGGGINGAGIAADAAGRGLSVALFEANDFASATSSASSKLIHGGLRYLEHYEFRLVSEALAEREVLLKKAPHIAWPMRFRLPHRPFLRPAWMIRAGLFLYDNLGKRTTLPGSTGVDLSASGLLHPEIRRGFEYSDCWVDDARLVIENVKQAAEHGATVRNYSRVINARRNNDLWLVEVEDQFTGKCEIFQAHALVNAAGPWVKAFINDELNQTSPMGIRLIKGSHIIVPRLHGEPQAYILQNDDGRIVFVIPYLDRYSLIGTTDVEYHGDPRDVAIDDNERQYLLDVVNAHFVKQLQRDDIVWDYSGVRPLCDDESDSPQAITRDYTLHLEQEGEQAPLLSIFGGKLTTYRKLGEAAMQSLAPFFPAMGPSWTAEAHLPGGEGFDFDTLATQLNVEYPWLSDSLVARYLRQYGSRVRLLLEGVTHETHMGSELAPQIYSREIDYLIANEMVRCGDDILWRRTKLGVSLTPQQRDAVSRYVEAALQQNSKIA